ncbi:MAG TPA: DSD1 family PLP-dependent enzyme [Geminicoccaceae bacterium]|nr:DSD1 family PLP-dependent enzyme [Geminicoccus sp.]HMU51548.1 DSD1 family PLP-dependent enzyme [Geminicoccaceae bacterium]
MSTIGLGRDSIDTPALLVDLDVMEANIARVAAACREHGIAWRPHVKAHKTPEIARMQLAAGAIGVTCAKLGEAEVMADAGIGDILIANQIVGAIKIGRLMELRARADVVVAVDGLDNVRELDAAAARAGLRLRVVIEVDTGMGRAGVAPEAVVALARRIAACEGLLFAGVMTWESHTMTIAEPAEKAAAVAGAIRRLVASAGDCRSTGLEVPIVSCGGTGTFPHCTCQPGVTEVQVGGGIFSDVRYREGCRVELPCALTILATVTSRPTPTRIITDAGKKAMSTDTAVPQPLGLDAHAAVSCSAEHSTIELRAPSDTPKVGDRLELVVGYSDTTIHLHEEIVGIRRGRVESVWRVAARGRLK